MGGSEMMLYACSYGDDNVSNLRNSHHSDHVMRKTARIIELVEEN